MKIIRLLLAIAVISILTRAQTLEVTPNRVMVDESATIRATGLQPNERVAIRASLTDGADHAWSSEAEFVAGAQGAVDTSRQAPVKGSYKEVSSMGLIWSMMPTAKGVAAYRPPQQFAPQMIEFQLLRKGKPVANATLEQRAIADGVKRTRLEGNLHGVFFVPPGSEPHPGVLVLGGSDGGVPSLGAAWLASHGYAALALAYFRHEDLPPRLEAIPLEYFGHALAWMMQQPDILADHIGVLGTSRGGELALQLASMYPQINAVVAYVPANVRYPACCGNTRVPYAWTWKGQPLAFVPPRYLHRGEPEAIAAIAVEQAHGPVLLIAGQNDGVWDSSGMTAAIADRLRRAKFPYQYEVLRYPHAGHLAGRPEIVPAWHGSIIHPVSGREIELGGNPRGDAESSIDAIPKVLTFLQHSLGADNTQH